MIKNNKIILPKIKGRTFVIGDLHGQFDLLKSLLDEFGFDYKHERVVAVGDLIDRGPKSFECLNMLNEPWFYSALGNHDFFLLSAVKNKSIEEVLFWALRNGGGWVFPYCGKDLSTFLKLSRPEMTESFKEIIEALSPLAKLIEEKMPLAIEFESRNSDRIGVCHAAVPNFDWNIIDEIPLKLLINEGSIIWDRSQLEFTERYVQGVDEVCHGHSIMSSLTMLGNRRYLDMGAFATGRLGYQMY